MLSANQARVPERNKPRYFACKSVKVADQESLRSDVCGTAVPDVVQIVG